MNYFITGTDTDVGKTFVVSLWIRALRASGLDAVGMKPICCGDRGDAEALYEASEKAASLNDINPIWMRTPVAPYTACAVENRLIDIGQILENFAKLRAAHRSVLVEGAGGWLVPIRRDYFVADLAVDFDLPVVVVVRNRLGALNHTLLTVRDIRRSGLTCAGLVLNNMDEGDGVASVTNRSMLEELSELPILFEVERNQTTLNLAVA